MANNHNSCFVTPCDIPNLTALPLYFLPPLKLQWCDRILAVPHSPRLAFFPRPWLGLHSSLFLRLQVFFFFFRRHKQKNGTLNLNRTASGRVELQSMLSRRFPPPWHTLVEVENNWIKEKRSLHPSLPPLYRASDFSCSREAMRAHRLLATNDLSPSWKCYIHDCALDWEELYH